MKTTIILTTLVIAIIITFAHNFDRTAAREALHIHTNVDLH